jgi:hypothetical protein
VLEDRPGVDLMAPSKSRSGVRSAEGQDCEPDVSLVPARLPDGVRGAESVAAAVAVPRDVDCEGRRCRAKTTR